MVRLHHVRGIASVSELKKRSGQELGLGARVKGFVKQIKALAVTMGIDADHRRCFWALQRVARA